MHPFLPISIFILALFMIAEATDTLSRGQSLTGSQTLISNNGWFELGFFPPNNRIQNPFYLSIRYTKFSERSVVWTANRENPLINKAGSKLEISADGSLELSHDSVPRILWSNPMLSSANNVETVVAVLGDDGNLVLREGGRRLWQSFDHPTNTWLPGAKLGSDKSKGSMQRLISWKSGGDPSPGLFSAEISESRKMVLKLNASAVYYETGKYENGELKSAPELSSLLTFDEKQPYATLATTPYVEYNDSSSSKPVRIPVFSMIVMDEWGNLIQKSSSGMGIPQVKLMPPQSFGFCGAFGILNTSSGSSNPCTCLKGFAREPGEGILDWSCYRMRQLDCGNKFGFEEISGIMLPEEARSIDAAGSDEACKLACHNCSCLAYAFNRTGCFIWEGSLKGLQYNISNNQKLQLKLPKGEGLDWEVIVGAVVPAFMLLSCGLLGFFYYRRTKQKEENKDSGEDLLCFDFGLGFNSIDDTMILGTRNHKEFDLPMFTYLSVSTATNNFSPVNKLGEGGFGPVFKGTLLNGQEIALKRLSQKSGQGFEEFKNEIVLISKLQHRNLVRLLGYCLNHDESILIYEYMPNKSLDFFLFGTEKKEILDWKTRINIVEGIAQGLLYLHEHSRVHIVHRDLKASNILLDDEMNPKISDFGMARIFGGNDSQTHTNKVVGTFGYIAPEYAMEGLFSTKSDVYSFGVLLLEIISGRKNTGFPKTESVNLLGHAWDLWISDRGVDLVEDKVRFPAAATALRYIKVGLLCVQGDPNDRPEMSSVVSMLRSEIADLPLPKKAAFTTRSVINTIFTKKNSGGEFEGPFPTSINDLTISDIYPR